MSQTRLLRAYEIGQLFLAHSARADMYRRLGRTAEARSSYEKPLVLTQQEPERQFLQRADSAAEIKIDSPRARFRALYS